MDKRFVVLILVVVSSFLALPTAAIENAPFSEYQQRRLRLAEQIRGNVLVIEAAKEVDLFEYRQENNFFYLTGLGEPDATLLLDASKTPPQEILFIPARDLAQERWTGPKLGPGPEAEKTTGFARVQSKADLQGMLNDFREAGTPVLALKDVSSKIAAMRQVKSAFEIRMIERAVEITMKGLTAAAKAVTPGAYEYEVEAALEFEFRRNGAERPGFPSIVGSGPFSTILHYNANSRRMAGNELVVLDVGAEYSGYTADVTRTFPVSGRFSTRQREIYQIVLDAQKAAIAQVKPGATIRDNVHAAAYNYIKSKGYERYFIHGTTHHMGLDVHDVGDTRRPLEAGMVITVEPGIYIPEEQLGVRIEDDFVVTSTGSRHLSTFPREIGEIERLLRQ